ncbi:MAG TPA: NAD-dependent DNA ligase LigA, partial [Candidatus Nitrosotenuis sp.]|nr:NAD-dependent DNA ligase LigA [Candidatus Nitrosotenuis sp.]
MDEPVLHRLKELRRLIEHHNLRYHQLDAPEISDAEFDALVGELRELEARHPELSRPLGVGAPPSPLFAPVVHRRPMMSLDNATRFEELLAWGRRLERLVEGDLRYVCELKIDGVAVSLLYRQGRLEQAATRGDGRTG